MESRALILHCVSCIIGSSSILILHWIIDNDYMMMNREVDNNDL